MILIVMAMTKPELFATSEFLVWWSSEIAISVLVKLLN